MPELTDLSYVRALCEKYEVITIMGMHLLFLQLRMI